MPFILLPLLGGIGALWGRDALFGEDSWLENAIGRFQWGLVIVGAVAVWAFLKYRKKK